MAAKKSSATKGNKKVLEILNQIFQAEMAGIIRYMHYSFMIMGYHRIPIQAWFRAQANESMAHATIIGEKITSLGGHPPMVAMKIEESDDHAVNKILEESLEFESETLELYKQLAKSAGKDIALEEMAREFVRTETEHCEEVAKMLLHVTS
ncbi:MAG: bacterioferritin [Xanthomonadaceae bacterium]|nr:bacterioferritin [Xanthomonadaceae bacterium]